VKHIERCDRKTYCGRPIKKIGRDTEFLPGDVPQYDCVEPWKGEELPHDLCARCRKGVTRKTTP